ncbi:MAG: hypothetical protein L3K19_05340 [Thermoplasmata archaeon]|nr:hypothetical protein [Thermoplasmata archaeon]
MTNRTGPLDAVVSTMVFDARDHYFVLVTAENSTGQSSTYILASGGGWTRETNTATPKEIDVPIMAYDAADGYVLLFTTSTGWCGTYCNETWAFSGGNWTDLTRSVSNSPPPLTGASMTFDAADGYVVVFGGADQGGSLGCGASPCSPTWTYRSGLWTRLNPPTSPPGRDYAAMTYDSKDQQVVLFSGAYASNDTWVFRSGNWTLLHTSVAPSPRAGASFAYDPWSQEGLLFGGGSGAGNLTLPSQTWLFQDARWLPLGPVPSPSNRSYAVMAYDPDSHKILLAGGSDEYQSGNGFGTGVNRNDSWEWWAPEALVANFSFHIQYATCEISGGVTNYVLLNASPAGGAPPYTYTWTLPTGGATEPDTNTTLTWGQNRTVTLTVADSQGTTAMSAVTLSMQLPPCPPPPQGPFYTNPPGPAWWTAGIVLASVLVLAVSALLLARRRRGRSMAAP